MAAIPATFVGVATSDTGQSGNVTLVGMLSATGLGVGGGPAEPPPGIWPSPGHPAHPIVPGQPPGIWPSPGYPAHPIVPGQPPGIWPSPGHPDNSLPVPPEVPPGTPPDTVIKSPPDAGGWGYYTDSDGTAYSAYRPASGAGPK